MKKLISLCLVVVFASCKTYQTTLTKKESEVIKEKFNLSKKEFKQIRSIDSIIGQLKAFVPIEDTLKVYYANKRLDSFFLKEYSVQKTYFTIYAERILRDEFTDLLFDKKQSNDDSPEFKSPEEFKAHIKETEKALNQSFKESLKKKDSL